MASLRRVRRQVKTRGPCGSVHRPAILSLCTCVVPECSANSMPGGIFCRNIGLLRTHTLRTRLPNRRPLFSVGLCLLAVALLYAPFAAAAWSARGMACCAGDHCPIPQHHHRKAPIAPDVADDCGHNMGGLSACTMSCCNTTDRQLASPVAFVLPALTTLSVSAEETSLLASRSSLEFSRVVKPLSPPPRLLAAAS